MGAVLNWGRSAKKWRGNAREVLNVHWAVLDGKSLLLLE
jgi:hypothetical protein